MTPFAAVVCALVITAYQLAKKYEEDGFYQFLVFLVYSAGLPVAIFLSLHFLISLSP